MRAFYLGLLLLLLLGSCQRLGAPATPGDATENRRDNRPASPDFTLPTTDTTLTLRRLRGSYVLLDFRAPGCAECAAQNANLRKIYGQFSSRGLVMVSVWNAADPAAWRAALSAEPLPWAQALDQSGEVSRAYGVKQPPVAVLLDPRGYELARNLRGTDLGQEISVHIPLD